MRYIWLNAVPIVLAGLAGWLPLALLWRRAAVRLAPPVALVWIAAIFAGALIIAPVPADPWVVAIVTAVILWGGFIFPALLATSPARGVSWRDTLLDAGGWLLALMLQAVVLRMFTLVAP